MISTQNILSIKKKNAIQYDGGRWMEDFSEHLKKQKVLNVRVKVTWSFFFFRPKFNTNALVSLS